MKTANDLRDKRDALVESLAKNIAIDVVEDEFGAVNITVGGKTLVSRSVLGEIRFINKDPLHPETATLEWYEPTHNVSQGPVNLYGGALKGYLDMRDEVIPNYQEKISTLAKTIAEEVNTLHRAGFALDKSTGRDFFVISDLATDFSAGNIRVNPDIEADVNLIATAGTDDPDVFDGDNTNATAIAQLKNKLTLNGGTASFDDYYTSLIGQLGVQGQETSQMLENKTYIIEQLNNRRDAISGVSLDEEMTNMIRYQHAYTAAARVINVMDEMMDVLVNKLGMVGR
jgi:flagellar hook-associated protein 1 FlgK